ncbi:hypothetical protein [Chamaesiphon polymorphus]|uniref:Uncharacterized protein n=1 Tax=Chamaesiphon polymorphus CCALA 037 TaxID=2107692 RepID=A0A2T1GK71_9CYAN|nr:hypothetical protein [Chamaesiphon polymorphus]PSB58220.1 hypothetical protein C7B77_05515 [Chamaesiphon polymorphus CCALA 037]
MQDYKTIHNYTALSDPKSTVKQEVSEIDSFFDITDEEISTLAKEATKAAVKDLHDRGISTYGMRDGIMYETKPNGEKVSVSDAASQS